MPSRSALEEQRRVLAGALVVVTVFALRAITVFAFAAAIGALVVTVLALIVGAEGREWIHAIVTLGLQFAVALGAAAGGKALLMPSNAMLLRRTPAGRSQLPFTGILLLTLFIALAGLQIPGFARWFVADLALARELIPSGPDPLGFALVPVVLLASAPALASLALLAAALASVLALASRAMPVTRVLAACALLQAGLVGALFVDLRGMRDLGAAVQQFVSASPDADLTARVAEWLARYDAINAPFGARAAWLLLVYLVMLGFIWLTPQAPIAASPDPQPVHDPPRRAHETFGPAIPRSTAPTVFDETLYSVRPRKSWLGVFDWRSSEYDITAIPPRARSRFFLSWKTGTLQRDAAGTVVLSVRASGDGYAVNDAATGSLIGFVAPVGSDYELRDADGGTLASVLEIKAGMGGARYVTKAGDREIGRMVWGFLGATVQSAELQIEFLPEADAQTRSLSIVLGPILEQRARRISQRRMT